MRRRSDQSSGTQGTQPPYLLTPTSAAGSNIGNSRLSVPSPRRSIIKVDNVGRLKKVSKSKRTGFTKIGEAGKHGPSAPTNQADGWQLKNESIMSRVVTLFNCHTMSDVLFTVGLRQIPAHKFVLAAASPVLHAQLYEDSLAAASGQPVVNKQSLLQIQAVAGSIGPGEGPFSGFAGMSSQLRSGAPSDISGVHSAHHHNQMGGGAASPVRSNIVHVEVHQKYEDFYELLRFLYTDEINITLENVTALVFMSDDFRLPSLSDACLDFLRDDVRAGTCLRILSILRSLMKKAVVLLWKETIERAKDMRKFKELSLAERQRQLAAIRGEGSTTGSGVSRQNSQQSLGRSRAGSESGFSDGGFSMASGVSRRSQRFSCYDGAESSFEGSDVKEQDKLNAAAHGTNTKTWQLRNNLYYQLALTSEELSEKCWRLIREETQVVIGGDDWVEQDMWTIRAILNLDMCSVSESSLFRALNRWGEHQCIKQGTPTLPEFRRQAIGEDTLLLVRFPTMSVEELQWEVVPTGLLNHQVVRQLHDCVKKGTSKLSQFNAEPRVLPLSDMQELQSKGQKDNGEEMTRQDRAMLDARGDRGASAKLGGERPGAYGRGVYAAHEGDTTDAILGARLWRSHVETFVDEQEDMGLAHEAGVPFGKDTDVRPVHCGNVMGQLQQKRGDAPHRQHRTLLRRPDAQSPMAMSARRPLADSPFLPKPPMTAPPASARRPAASSMAVATSAMAVGGAPLQSAAIGGGAIASSPPKHRRPSQEGAGHHGALPAVLHRRGSQEGGQSSYAGVPASPSTRRPVTSDGTGAKAGSPDATRHVAMPSDFERLASGLYCYRCQDLIELRLLDGDPLVYKHGPVDQRIVEDILHRHPKEASSCLRRWGATPQGRGAPAQGTGLHHKSPKSLGFISPPTSPYGSESPRDTVGEGRRSITERHHRGSGGGGGHRRGSGGNRQSSREREGRRDSREDTMINVIQEDPLSVTPLTDDEVRQRFGLHDLPRGAGIPLDAFIYGM